MIRRSILFCLFIAASVSVCAAQLPVNFAWDASTSIDTTGVNPVKYRLCYSSAPPVGDALPSDRVTIETGSSLTGTLTLPVGTHYVFATAYWFALVGDPPVPSAETIESGPSNVLKLVVFAPPGRPDKIRIKSATGMADASGAAPAQLKSNAVTDADLFAMLASARLR